VAIEARLTQLERVETMRARLLDAALECLVAKGYSELSTNDVVRRAGVSRGALAHHFPTKAELLAAVSHHLLDQGAAVFRASFLALEPHRHTIAEAIDLLWSFYAGAEFAAMVELIVAARTDPVLQEALADGPERIATVVIEVFAELFPEAAQNTEAEPLLRATLAMLGGLALQTIVDNDRYGHQAALRELIKTIGSATFEPNGPGGGASLSTRQEQP
jgi:AcrR family transcriptional regulator